MTKTFKFGRLAVTESGYQSLKYRALTAAVTFRWETLEINFRTEF